LLTTLPLQAINAFIHQPKYRKLTKHELDNVQQKALCNVHEWLRILHSVQELVSAEKTPTLSVVLTAYWHAQKNGENPTQDCACNLVLCREA
jgi:hypothetical protein